MSVETIQIEFEGRTLEVYRIGVADCAKGRVAWLPFRSYLDGYAHQYALEQIENEKYPV